MSTDIYQVVLMPCFGIANSNLPKLILEKEIKANGNITYFFFFSLFFFFFPFLFFPSLSVDSGSSSPFPIPNHTVLRFVKSFTLFLLLGPEAFKWKCYMCLHQIQHLCNEGEISPSLTIWHLKIDTFNLKCCCSCTPSKSSWKSNILQQQLQRRGEYTALCDAMEMRASFADNSFWLDHSCTCYKQILY